MPNSFSPSGGLVSELATQFGLGLNIGDPDSRIEELLASRLEEMIRDDFPGLVRLLYRIDVDEGKLRDLLEKHAGDGAARTMAALIMERQRQKEKSRQMHRPTPPKDNEESW